jgi:hypothetical protein
MNRARFAAPRRISYPAVFLFFLWCFTFFLIYRSLLIPLFDPDLWWHLAVGRAMVETHHFLKTETFSYTFNGAPWVNFEWLAEAVGYLAYQWGGFSGIYWLKIGMSLAVMVVLALAIRRSGLRGPLLLIGTWAGFLVLRPRLFERAELASLLFLGLLTLFVLAARSDAKFHHWRFYAVSFLLMVIWVNAHAGFVYGLALLGCWELGARWSKEKPIFIAELDRLITLFLVATLLTPHGFYMGRLILELMSGFGPYQKLVSEWSQPLVRHTPYFWSLYVAVMVGMSIVVLKKWTPLLLWFPALFLFGVWGSSSYRNTVLLAFPAIPFLSEVAQKIVSSQKSKTARWIQGGAWVTPIALIAAHLPLAKIGVPVEKISMKHVPQRAALFVQAAGINGRMYNSYGMGGYLDWALAPERPIFMDQRYLFFPLLVEGEQLNQQLKNGLTPRPWQNYLRSWQVDYSIVEYPNTFFRMVGASFEGPLPTTSFMFPRTDWALLHWDDIALIFVRREAKFRDLIQRYEYKVARPYCPAQMQFLLKNKFISADEFQRDIDRQQAENGPTRIGEEMRRVLASVTDGKAKAANDLKIPG